MSNRIASLNQAKAFLKGGETIAPDSEQGIAIVLILEGLTRTIETYLTRSESLSLLQVSAAERYGNQPPPRGYGRHNRNVVILRRKPVASVTTVDDDGTAIDSDNYRVDSEAGILYRLRGKFSDSPLAVEITYTAGYAEVYDTVDDDNTRRLAVPLDIRNATLKQLAHEWSKREPGGAVYGATSVARPDGSVIFDSNVAWLRDVKATLDFYRWSL